MITSARPALAPRFLAKASCVVCRHDRTVDFYHSDQSPTHIGVVYSTREAALRAAKGKVSLSHCPSCNLIHNRDAGRRHLTFEPGFEVQLTHSPTFRAFLESVSQRLIEAHHLHGKDILDAGCGAGDFLRLLCERGRNRGLGIDPAVARDTSEALGVGVMELRRGDFSSMQIDQSFDFAVSQSVLELIPEPVAFLRKMRDAVASRQGTVYVETFNGAKAIQQGESWSVCYELCNYFVLETLMEAAQQAGLRVTNAGHCFGRDQYIFIEAQADAGPSKQTGPVDSHLAADVERFRTRHESSLALWSSRIADFRRTSRKAVVWGSGGKGISFLNAVRADDVFRAVIDINPCRQGKFIPGTGHEIVSPNWLVQHRPDVIVISNPLYETEIRAATVQLGVGCEFLTL